MDSGSYFERAAHDGNQDSEDTAVNSEPNIELGTGSDVDLDLLEVCQAQNRRARMLTSGTKQRQMAEQQQRLEEQQQRMSAMNDMIQRLKQKKAGKSAAAQVKREPVTGTSDSRKRRASALTASDEVIDLTSD